MTTAERIDAILKDRGMSRRQLAICANIPPSSLQSAMERNKPLSFEMQEKISHALEVSVYELLGDDERRLFTEADAGVIFNYVKQGYKFTSKERLLLKIFHILNEDGQDVAVDRVAELSEISRYCRPEALPPSDALSPTQEGKDTTPAEPPPESLGNAE